MADFRTCTRMSQTRTVSGDLYVVGRTASLVMTGLAIETTHDACLEVIDGEVRATKFGLYEITPSKAVGISERADGPDRDIYDSVERGVDVRLFHAGSNYWLPTTLERAFFDDEYYAVYDTENDVCWRPAHDQRELHIVNLFSFDKKSVEQLTTEEFEAELHNRFMPLVGIRR